MTSWNEISAWRKSKRAELLSHRQKIAEISGARVELYIRHLIRENFPELADSCIGLYWPIFGEIDPRYLVRDLLGHGATAALPVVVEKNRPLEYWAWEPGMKCRRGIFDIPIPAQPAPVMPTALLVPLLGFDDAGFRLGYGGGYYDRTLAAMSPRPLTIGMGYAFGRQRTIYPQAHDIGLDAIVTELGAARFDSRQDRTRRNIDQRPVLTFGTKMQAGCKNANELHEKIAQNSDRAVDHTHAVSLANKK